MVQEGKDSFTGKLENYLHWENLQDAPFQVLVKFLKLLKDVIFLVSSGKEFQSLAACNLNLVCTIPCALGSGNY